MAIDLPAEIWMMIFQYAVQADDERIFNKHLPDTMSESTWFKRPINKKDPITKKIANVKKWMLRAPHENLHVLQKQRISFLKSVVSTSKYWRRIGAEFLFAGIFFEDPLNILRLCAALDSDRHLGKWVRRFHLTRYYPRGGRSEEDMADALASIVQHCKKLEIFIVEWPLLGAFIGVANALCTFCYRTLRSLSLNLSCHDLAKVILMLQTLTSLVSVHLEFGEREDEEISLGSAGDLILTLQNMEQLSLKGFYTDFVEQAIDWELPALQSLTLDFLNYRDGFPDLVEFLRNHGAQLTYLDIDCVPPMDVSAILDVCPMLVTFSFNLDWRLPPDETLSYESSLLVNHPHNSITTIGCHGLLYAFGVGYGSTFARIDPLNNHWVRGNNDRNFIALTKRNFPKLQCVRMLDRQVLRDLESANGPDKVCHERWERWWRQCAGQKVRLEDCTGKELGYLPEDSDDEENDDEEIDDESVASSEVDVDPIAQVRYLTGQCRRMAAALSGGAL